MKQIDIFMKPVSAVRKLTQIVMARMSSIPRSIVPYREKLSRFLILLSTCDLKFVQDGNKPRNLSVSLFFYTVLTWSYGPSGVLI